MSSSDHPYSPESGAGEPAPSVAATRAVVLHGRQLVFGGRPRLLVCDGQCSKAWGVTRRPRHVFGGDPNDFVYMADDELEAAPPNPGTYEGGYAKPDCHANSNKWCARECERSALIEPGEPVRVLDHGQRIYNQPRKHGVTNPLLVPAFSADGKPSLASLVAAAKAAGDTTH